MPRVGVGETGIINRRRRREHGGCDGAETAESIIPVRDGIVVIERESAVATKSVVFSRDDAGHATGDDGLGFQREAVGGIGELMLGQVGFGDHLPAEPVVGGGYRRGVIGIGDAG